MAKTKAQKGEIIDSLAQSFKSAASVVFVHFTKFNVSDESKMRRELKKEGVTYTVARKTLIKRALQAAGHDAIPELKGELAVAVDSGKDSTLAARLVHGFGKTFGGDKLSILGGLFEGRLLGETEMREVATIPSVDTLRGMFANVLNSPLQRFAVVLSKVAETKN